MQKIRKSIAGLLALVLAVGLMTPYAMAADSPLYTVTNTFTEASQNVYKVSFSLKNTIGVTAMQALLKYDKNVWRPCDSAGNIAGDSQSYNDGPFTHLSTGLYNEHNQDKGLLCFALYFFSRLAPNKTTEIVSLYMKLNAGKTLADLKADSLCLASDNDYAKVNFHASADCAFSYIVNDPDLYKCSDDGTVDWTITYPNCDDDGTPAIQTANVGITLPAGGKVPSTVITAGTGYTAKLEWLNAPSTTFAYNTQYTAKVTLTATNPASLRFGQNTVFTVNGTKTGVTKGNVSNNKAEFTYTYTSAANDPASEILKTAKTTAESATYTTTRKTVSNFADAKAELQKQVNALPLGDGVTAVVNNGSYIAPIDGTAEDGDGTDGSYTATVTLSKYSTIKAENIDETVNVTMNITARGYEEKCQPPVPACDSPMTIVAPSTTDQAAAFIYTYKSEQGITVGRISLFRQDGTSFTLSDAVDPTTIYNMKAEPQAGYSFMGWTNPEDSNTTITGIAFQLNGCKPSFKEAAIKLSNITVCAGDDTLDLHGNDGSTGFQSSMTAYELYLRPEQKELTLKMKVMKSGDEPTLKVDNKEPSNDSIVTGAAFNTYSYSTTVTGPEKGKEQQVKIELTTEDGPTTYRITVNRLASDPQIISEISSCDGDSNQYKVSLKLHKAIVNSFQLQLQIGELYEAFADAEGKALTTSEELQEAYLNKNSGFNTRMTLADKTLTMVFYSKDGSYIDALNNDVEVALLYLKTDKVSDVTADDLKDCTVVKESAILFDERVGTITSKTLSDGSEDIAPVVLQQDTVYLMGYINALTLKKGTWVVTSLRGATIAKSTDFGGDGDFAIELINDQAYKIAFVMPNYLTREIKVDGSAINEKQAKIFLGTYALIAGDIDGNGKVDTFDRAELIKHIFELVESGGYGDINGDGVVNAIDIGYVMPNINKKYPDSDAVAVTK